MSKQGSRLYFGDRLQTEEACQVQQSQSIAFKMVRNWVRMLRRR